MKNALLCQQILDVNSDLSLKCKGHLVVNRFPEYECVIYEEFAEDGYITAYLLFKQFRKGIINAMDFVCKKHNKILASTEDERIVRILVNKFNFEVVLHNDKVWKLKRLKNV